MATIDYNFISRLEGGQQLNGYVPEPENSQSGVTIATGFDLGARNEQDLRNLGITGELFAKLSPYLGKKRQDAVNALAQTPLTITKAEATLIDQAVKSSALGTLEAQYDAAISSDKVPFDKLPTQIQTVIASVSFQYGDLSTRTPTFWQHVVDQDWTKAIAELKNFGDDYPTRRNQEAQLMAEGLIQKSDLGWKPEQNMPESRYAQNSNATSPLTVTDLQDAISTLSPQELQALGDLSVQELQALLNENELTISSSQMELG